MNVTKPYRKEKYGVLTSPEEMERFSNEHSAWYESPDEIEEEIHKAEEKTALLKWVRKQMHRRLTRIEKRYIELYFFEGLTYREAARATKTNPSSVLRGVRRALRKLRLAAQQDDVLRSKVRAR